MHPYIIAMSHLVQVGQVVGILVTLHGCWMSPRGLGIELLSAHADLTSCSNMGESE